MYYIYMWNEQPKIEKRSSPPPGQWWEADQDHPHLECYEWIDGVPFLSERLIADRHNRIAKEQNDLLLKK